MLQHRREFARLLALYRTVAPRRILEIGTHLGGTLYHWLRLAPAGATVAAVDLHHASAELYPRWAGAGVEEIAVITGDSNDPVIAEQAAEHGPFDWLFIDADHHYRRVLRDWQLYSPLAASPAVVAFHDIAESDDPTVDVAPLWQELKASHPTIEILEPGGFGIGALILGPEDAVARSARAGLVFKRTVAA